MTSTGSAPRAPALRCRTPEIPQKMTPVAKMRFHMQNYLPMLKKYSEWVNNDTKASNSLNF
jgi:hypothetical protein